MMRASVRTRGRHPGLVVVATWALVRSVDASGTPPAAPELSADTFASWRATILPGDAEVAWRRIPWRTGLQLALKEADAAERPILVWLMNGHPLGCT